MRWWVLDRARIGYFTVLQWVCGPHSPPPPHTHTLVSPYLGRPPFWTTEWDEVRWPLRGSEGAVTGSAGSVAQWRRRRG